MKSAPASFVTSTFCLRPTFATLRYTSTSTSTSPSFLRRPRCTPLDARRLHFSPTQSPPSHRNGPLRPLTCTPACSYGDDEGKAKLVSYCVNQGVEREVAARVLELAERTVRDWSVCTSDFLTPPESVALETALRTRPSLQLFAWGGYEEAERRMLFLAHDDVVLSDAALRQLAQEQVQLLVIRADGSQLGHRDFLGALTGCGVSRSKVGDIVVQPGGSEAHLLVHEDMARVVQASLSSVGTAQASVEVRPAADLTLPSKRVKDVQTVESSMRLDAVVSTGLKLSRSKLADMTRAGLVYLNYKETRSPAKNVKQGDVVSVRGVGKLKIDECATTSKGRFRILIKRYL